MGFSSNLTMQGGNTSTASKAPPGQPKEKVRLQGVEKTMLAMVLFKFRDAQSPNPILGDPYAEGLLNRCDVDLSIPPYSYGGDPRWNQYICHRSKIFDQWCQEFLYTHQEEPVTVLHMACGLDCRHLRVQKPPGAQVRWIDLDKSSVVDLRSRLMPARPLNHGDDNDYTLRTLEVGNNGWLRDIPSDRPTLIVAEGLFMYLEPAAAHKAIQDLVDYFGSHKCTLVFDTMGSLSVRLMPLIKGLKSINSPFQWGVDEAEEILTLNPERLNLRDRVMWPEFMEKHPPHFGSRTTAMLSLLPVFKKNIQFWRFDF